MKRLIFFILTGISVIIPASLNGFAAELYTFQEKGGPAYYTNVPGPGRYRVNLALKKTHFKSKKSIPKMISETPMRGVDYGDVILSACERFAVDPNLVKAVIKAESNFNSGAVSSKGAMGLMQLMPGTAREMGVSDPFDPVENIHGGVNYLSRLLTDLNGDLSLAIAAYNAGPERVKSHKGIPPFRETRNYVQRVLGYYELLKGKEEI